MASLLRQAARRIGGSVLQRTQAAVTSPAVAEKPRRFVPKRVHSTGEGGGEDGLDKWGDTALRFRRFDSDFTNVLNTVAAGYCSYAILACGESPPWPIRKYRLECEEEGAQTDTKKLEW